MPAFTSVRRAHIIGAGISGLSTAYFLTKQGWQVEIFEKKSEVGGLLQTRKANYGLVEASANGILNSSLLESLCTDVGVQLEATRKEARNRYIFRRGRPRRWPTSFFETFRIFIFALRFVLAKGSLRPRPNETLREWGTRTLGLSVSQYVLETALQGVYAGDPQKLSASLLLTSLFKKKAKDHKKPLKLGRGTVAPVQGMGELTDKLSKYLQAHGVRIHLNCDAENLARISHLDPAPTEALIIATSADQACKILKNMNDPRAEILEKIEMRPLTTTTVFWQSAKLDYPGFGILFPATDAHAALGVLRPKSIFSQRAGEAISPETWILPTDQLSHAQVKKLVEAEHKKISMQKSNPVWLAQETIVWPKALPHYTTQWETELKKLKIARHQVYLIGNYLGEIGLRQILDRAKSLATQLAEEFE